MISTLILKPKSFKALLLGFAWPSTRPNRQIGSSLVEFALLLPVLILLLFGTIDLGRLAYVYIETMNAARAGVSYGSQNHATASNNAGMVSAAQNDAADISGLSAVAKHFCKCADGSSSTCQLADCSSSHMLVYVQVDTTAQYRPWFPYPGIPSLVSVKGEAVMRAGE
jgi:Flp pilus assembly protein TadG